MNSYIFFNIRLLKDVEFWQHDFRIFTHQIHILMIQRIQTLYLLLGLLAAILMFVFPFATFVQGDISAVLKGTGLEAEGPGSLPAFSLSFLPGLVAALLGLLFLVTIFQYKNRKLQIRLLLVAMFLNLILIGLIFLLSGQIQKLPELGEVPSYGISTYLSLLCLLLIVLANRGIRKDQALVRSADRLR